MIDMEAINAKKEEMAKTNPLYKAIEKFEATQKSIRALVLVILSELHVQVCSP
jgi:hypothetical protein